MSKEKYLISYNFLLQYFHYNFEIYTNFQEESLKWIMSIKTC